MRWGIRIRITALAAAAVAVVLGVAAVALVNGQRRALTANLDDSLGIAADELAQASQAGELPSVLPVRIDDDAVLQVTSPDGTVLAATPGHARIALLAPEGTGRKVRTVELAPSEPDYRLLSQRSGETVVHVGAPTDDIDESMAALRLGLAVALPLVVAALAALVWWLVGWTLRPVRAITSEVADIRADSLDRRVPVTLANDEIQGLARTMNDMLDRLQDAAQRQQRFVADASHELRSPLTRIRTELEVDARHPETADLAATHHSILDETRKLQALIDDLLLLARHDASTTPNRSTHRLVPLDDVVHDEASRTAATATVAVDTTGVEAVTVTGDADHLARAVRNLLDNAARYAASRISIALSETGGTAHLSISDDGPGIDPAHRHHIFERFTRLDPARARQGPASAGDAEAPGGTGLGLAIAHDIVVAHGGTIALGENRQPGARFEIDLPAAGGHS